MGAALAATIIVTKAAATFINDLLPKSLLLVLIQNRLTGDSFFFHCPFAQVLQLATLATKRSKNMLR